MAVAQLVERWIVVPVAEGSNPSTHPSLPAPILSALSNVHNHVTIDVGDILSAGGDGVTAILIDELSGGARLSLSAGAVL